MSARAEILARIASAGASGPVEVPRSYRGAGPSPLGQDALLDRLVDRLEDYRAAVHRCATTEVASTVGRLLAAAGVDRIVVPAGLAPDWLPAAVEAVGDDPPLTPQELDALDGVVTGCRLAAAETGTIVLDGGPGMGRRALSLVPDFHLVVVGAEQVLATVPDAVAALDPTRPQTWISGPSATSDIELHRVEGVHGPRRLVVVLVTPPT